MKRLLPCLAMISIYASVSFGAFDYTVTGYIDSTFPLDGKSLLVDGGGVKDIQAVNSSYVEVKTTLPLQPHIGGIGNVRLQDSSMKLINGQVDYISMYNSSYIDVLGGQILSNISTHSAGCTVSVSGGHINELTLIGFGTATLTGGEIDTVSFVNIDPSMSVTFICDLNTLNLTYDNGNLINATGEWLDGTSFDTDFSIGAFDEYVHFVPEPATLFFLGLGGLLIRRKK